jgi:hypothetical protein
MGSAFLGLAPYKAETKKMLEEFYKPYNIRLVQLLGDDKFYGKAEMILLLEVCLKIKCFIGIPI